MADPTNITETPLTEAELTEDAVERLFEADIAEDPELLPVNDGDDFIS